MMWGSGWGWGGWLAMASMMVLFWGLVVAGIIAIVRYINGSGQSGQGPDTGRRGAQGILDDRFARGEIDDEEYARRREALRSSNS